MPDARPCWPTLSSTRNDSQRHDRLRRFAAGLAIAAFGVAAMPARALADSDRLFGDGFEGAQRIKVPTTSGPALEAWLWRPTHPMSTPGPAVVMLHGCSGVYGSNGYGDESRISSRFSDWARRLLDEGVHVLLLDSFSTRDPLAQPALARQNYCGDRSALVAIQAREEIDRPRDARAGYDVLTALSAPGGGLAIDPARVAVIGWSHGGSAAMASVAEGTFASSPFVLAQSFYPGCGLYGAFGGDGIQQSSSSYRAERPLAIYLGLEDEVSVATVCDAHRLHSDSVAGMPFEVHAFESVGHSFDGARCVQAVDGALVSPWTWLRYNCSGSYDGEPFDLHDWQAKGESDRLAMCALLTAFGAQSKACTDPPFVP